MPKKAHGRPAKTKARTRRPTAQPAASGVAVAPPQTDGTTALAAEQPAAAATPATTAPRSGMPRTAAATRAPRRQPAAAARPTINYAYLRRDIRTLAVLAPSMVVILVVAFIIIH